MTTVMECTALSKDKAPTHLTLETLHRELNTMAMGVTSDRGGGEHGHLALVMTDEEYLELTNEEFEVPTHPGPNPEPGATQPIITENNRLHALAITEHKTYKDTETQLKAALLKAVPHTYIQELQDRKLGFATTTTKELLHHLDTNYGTVNFDDLTRNLEDMKKAWNGEAPIEDLWTQVQLARAYAEDHDPITEKAGIIAAVAIIKASGLFIDDLKAWNNKPNAGKTWITLKEHFNQANKNRLENPTVAHVGYAAKEANATDKTEDKENKKNRTNNSNNPFRNWNYCWSHGMNRSHNGHRCKFPLQGHIKGATINNTQNGSTVIVVGPRPQVGTEQQPEPQVN
jgi:hypothetical protein